MKIQFLGTGGYYPTADRQTSCLYLPECGIVFDAGSGISRLHGRPLPAHLHIFLTHAHLDHTMGLTWLPGMYEPCGIERLTLHAHGTLAQEAVGRLLVEPLFSRRWNQFTFLAECDELAETGTLSAGGVEVVWELHEHREHGALSYRVRHPDGASMALVTDTYIRAEEHAPFCQGADLLLTDCFFRDAQEHIARGASHSTPSAGARLAAEAGAGRLGLLHINPEEPAPESLAAEARPVFENVFVCRDEMEVRLG